MTDLIEEARYEPFLTAMLADGEVKNIVSEAGAWACARVAARVARDLVAAEKETGAEEKLALIDNLAAVSRTEVENAAAAERERCIAIVEQLREHYAHGFTLDVVRVAAFDMAIHALRVSSSSPVTPEPEETKRA